MLGGAGERWGAGGARNGEGDRVGGGGGGEDVGWGICPRERE